MELIDIFLFDGYLVLGEENVKVTKFYLKKGVWIAYPFEFYAFKIKNIVK
jgi:hypothetical protein